MMCEVRFISVWERESEFGCVPAVACVHGGATREFRRVQGRERLPLMPLQRSSAPFFSALRDQVSRRVSNPRRMNAHSARGRNL